MPVDLIGDGLIRFPEDEEPPVNPALTQWMEEAIAEGRQLPEERRGRRAQGPCRLCNERRAVHVCVHCQRDVCREDYWIMTGLCRECNSEDEIARAGQPKSGKPPELGIKWVED